MNLVNRGSSNTKKREVSIISSKNQQNGQGI
jgi:hypothetical protein